MVCEPEHKVVYMFSIRLCLKSGMEILADAEVFDQNHEVLNDKEKFIHEVTKTLTPQQLEQLSGIEIGHYSNEGDTYVLPAWMGIAENCTDFAIIKDGRGDDFKVKIFSDLKRIRINEFDMYHGVARYVATYKNAHLGYFSCFDTAKKAAMGMLYENKYANYTYAVINPLNIFCQATGICYYSKDADAFYFQNYDHIPSLNIRQKAAGFFFYLNTYQWFRALLSMTLKLHFYFIYPACLVLYNFPAFRRALNIPMAEVSSSGNEKLLHSIRNSIIANRGKLTMVAVLIYLLFFTIYKNVLAS